MSRAMNTAGRSVRMSAGVLLFAIALHSWASVRAADEAALAPAEFLPDSTVLYVHAGAWKEWSKAWIREMVATYTEPA